MVADSSTRHLASRPQFNAFNVAIASGKSSRISNYKVIYMWMDARCWANWQWTSTTSLWMRSQSLPAGFKFHLLPLHFSFFSCILLGLPWQQITQGLTQVNNAWHVSTTNLQRCSVSDVVDCLKKLGTPASREQTPWAFGLLCFFISLGVTELKRRIPGLLRAVLVLDPHAHP